ncbi:MAG TPA: nuclear transport factor 2 family protein [Thermoleophilaceae bacterium]|nr:nuclear transport factor 2 family protein [Thermoleophilaceae bacterium]
MSQESVALVRSGFTAFEQGDLTGMLDLMADDLVTYRADPDGATYHGKEGFLEATADWTEGFSDWSVIPEEFIDTGGSVLVRVRQLVRGEASGIPIEGEFWFVFEVRDSLVSKVSFYVRRAEALAEAASVE